MDCQYERYFPELAGRALDPLQYYEVSWQVRREVINDLIAEGEASLPRLLSRFVNFEKRYELRGHVMEGMPTGTLGYLPIKETGTALDRLETWRKGVLRGGDSEFLEHIQFDLSGMLVDFAEGADTILELGSGFGLQLFRLYHGGGPAQARYVGAEISPAGRDMAECLARLESGMRFQSVAFDLRSPDWSVLNGSRKALIFSAWSLMYVDRMADDFFSALAQWPGEATLVFCEPVGFQWGAAHPLSRKQAEVCALGKLNGDLSAAIGKAVAAGLIEPLVVAKDIFAKSYTAFDMFSVIVCHKPAA
ncbi:class I SAM-dependent methyltransferase [Magnetospirillum sulfuroxidans]|uniref:Methyltransferase domain-containing protein n=1 Tax=Magnetospirillum sulfuroxidans TaxID=611300 RepID=A0ABS5IB36_9PROT|nr:class I SAM-dependent methyltransferase [Magnetospirillum sulfuroxidans]MBR9971352.1 hypothetical protein [Magnetospirillum sulfuroxidans]